MTRPDMTSNNLREAFALVSDKGARLSDRYPPFPFHCTTPLALRLPSTGQNSACELALSVVPSMISGENTGGKHG